VQNPLLRCDVVEIDVPRIAGECGLPLEGIAKPDDVIGSHGAERSVVEATAPSQADARSVPGDEWHERNRWVGTSFQPGGIATRLRNPEPASAQGDSGRMQRELQLLADDARQKDPLAAPPSVLDQLSGRELPFARKVRQDDGRLDVRNERRQPSCEALLRSRLIGERQQPARPAHLLSDV